MPRSYLVLEHLETDPPPYDQPAGQIFGRRMAELHSKEPRDVDAKDGNFGAQASTIYEGVHQDNEWLEDWRLFFLEQRMSYQLAIAHEYRRDPQSEEASLTITKSNMHKVSHPQSLTQVSHLPNLTSTKSHTHKVSRPQSLTPTKSHTHKVSHPSFPHVAHPICFDASPDVCLDKQRLSREWKHLQSATGQLRAFFDGVDIKPATLHGALMRANMGSVEGWPTLFNPVGYYGHHEAEFGLTWCFEPGEDFWSGYRQIIPEASGFGIRHILYELYHRLVHYNVPLEIPVDQRRKFASEALTLFNILISTFDRRRRLSLNETGRALEEAPPVDPRWDSRWAKRVLDEAAAAGRLSRDSCALAAPHAARARAPAPPQSWFDDLHDRLRLWSAQTPFELGTCAAALGVHLSSRLELALRRSQRSGAAGATRRGTLGTECEWIADPAVSESLPDFPDFPDLPAQFRLPPLVPAPRQLLPPEWLDYAPLVREPRSPQAYGGGSGGGLSDHSNPPHSDVTPPHFISDGGIRLVSGVVSGALVFGGLVLCRSQVFRASFGRLMLRRSSEHS